MVMNTGTNATHASTCKRAGGKARLYSPPDARAANTDTIMRMGAAGI